MNKKILLALATFLCTSSLYAQTRGFDAFEKTIPELQAAMERGDTTSEELVRQYLDRIAAFDDRGPALNAMIHINERAIEDARTLDRERAASGSRGPLHGIPIVLKDNYDTVDMPTTGSVIALTGHIPPDDGYQVRKLREAGAVFIGKTNMHELARGIETISSLGGQTRNPYDPDRNPGGSSGGTGAAVAANFAAVGMGSDTCGSIRIPAANNNLFGLRVTQGFSSRDGIIPLSHTQDVGGPLARSMVDLVAVLDATVGPDPADAQTAAAAGHVPDTFTAFLDADALKGARIGVLTNYLLDSGANEEVTDVVRQALAVMTDGGADAVEFEIEGLDDLLDDSSVISVEFGPDLHDYLEQVRAPYRSLEAIMESGLYHAALEARFRRTTDTAFDFDAYRATLAKREELAAMIDAAMTAHGVDLLVYPTLQIKPARIGEPQDGGTCAIAAHSGYPAISLPAGFTPDGVPVAVELLARPFEEGRLVSMGYAWEQAASPRRPPARTPSLVSDTRFHEFKLESPQGRGALRLDRATQTLHYQFRLKGVKDRDILQIRLHRGGAGANGPVIELLGAKSRGAVAIRNEDLDDLLEGGLYAVVYTHDEPLGEARGQIVRR